MEITYTKNADGSITYSVTMKPIGSMLEQEEQIAEAVNALGSLATEASLKGFDSDGCALIVNNEKYTSRGKEKKNTKRHGQK